MPLAWDTLDPTTLDIRLVAADMDGTLLTAAGQLPADFLELLGQLAARGVTFVPASGRQYHSLRRVFAASPVPLSYIGENGSIVVHAGQTVSTTTVSAAVVTQVIDLVRAATPADTQLDLVFCGARSAYIERDDEAFRGETNKYYARLEVVEDLKAVTDQALKLAVYDSAGRANLTRALFAPVAHTNQVVVSGAHWIDIMDPHVSKGQALSRLQALLGVTSAQTMAFGDYFNDVEMLQAADYSFAVANAHPTVAASARYRAPSNDDDGVGKVLRRLLLAG
ncbi:HAD family hydrolase [Buchananella hordeovulneris]|uniref:HAD family hydrolase n=1 Tax=Buchananella hordeovulneris TaxID=52770 RepID=UPI001C9E6F02|nr:HAD family hydrolase [Buchananella hordeovulneris]